MELSDCYNKYAMSDSEIVTPTSGNKDIVDFWGNYLFGQPDVTGFASETVKYATEWVTTFERIVKTVASKLIAERLGSGYVAEAVMLSMLEDSPENVSSLYKETVAIMLDEWRFPEVAQRAVTANIMPNSEESLLRDAIGFSSLIFDFINSPSGVQALAEMTLYNVDHFGLPSCEMWTLLGECEEECNKVASSLGVEFPDNISWVDKGSQAFIEMARLSLGNDKRSLAVIQENSHLKQEIKRLEFVASHDSLTNLLNRGSGQKILDEMFMKRKKGGQENLLGVLMIDIDHFKKVNDTFQHAGGDKVLCEVTKIMGRVARRNGEHVVRYGGEEFMVVADNQTMQSLTNLAESIRDTISNHEFIIGGETCKVTVSVGGACINSTSGFKASDLVESADSCLYEAKEAGRNRLIIKQDILGA